MPKPSRPPGSNDSSALILATIAAVSVFILGSFFTLVLYASAASQTLDCGDSCAPSVYNDQSHIRLLAKIVFIVTLAISFISFWGINRKHKNKNDVLYLP